MSEFLPLGEWVDRGVKFVIDNDGGWAQALAVSLKALSLVCKPCQFRLLPLFLCSQDCGGWDGSLVYFVWRAVL